jgi:hypothetical protein
MKPGSPEVVTCGAVMQLAWACTKGNTQDQNRACQPRSRAISFMASGKILTVVNLLSFLVARIGQVIFDEEDMHDFGVFLVILAAVVGILFLMAQIMTHYHVVVRWKSMSIQFLDFGKRQDQAPRTSGKLMIRQVVHDFWRHSNCGGGGLGWSAFWKVKTAFPSPL